MRITLDWLGVATFRLTIGDLVVFLDAYMDRVPAAPPVGLSADDVRKAAFVLVGHSHFDHIAGAEVIAQNTGAKIIGSHESCRVMRERGVPKAQLVPSQGGERHRLADGVTARVFPSLHSCTWGPTPASCGEEMRGHLGLTEDERAAVGGLAQEIGRAARAGDERGAAIREHITNAAGSRHAGGALAYLIETPEGAIFWQDTSGCWTAVLAGIECDVAILAAAGRGNIDSEPVQGSLAQFVAREAALLRPRTVVLGHHDNWLPPVTREPDITPIRDELTRALPGVTLLEMGYLEGRPLLGS